MHTTTTTPRLGEFFRFGIRQKVVLILVTVLLTALTVSGWLALEIEKRDSVAEIQQRGEYISRFISRSLAYSVVGYDYHSIQLLLDELTLSDEIGFARVLSGKGNIMAESRPPRAVGDSEMITFHEPILFDDKVVGRVSLGLSMRTLSDRLESRSLVLLTREAVVIVLIAVGEFLALSYIIIRPVRLMSDSLRRNISDPKRSFGELPVLSNDEFGLLATQFNQLQKQLTEANQRLQSKIDLADARLRETNNQLVEQSLELQRMNAELKQLSLTDSLTGLHNRRYFENLMDNEIAISSRHGDSNSLLLIDLDRFKQVNDNHGHKVGDMVLKEVARVLTSAMRKTDVLCRVGGEEFVMLCRRADVAASVELAEKLRKTIESHVIRSAAGEVRVTASVGVATIPDRHNTTRFEEFYHHADIALYASKGEGRNRVTHYEQTLDRG